MIFTAREKAGIAGRHFVWWAGGNAASVEAVSKDTFVCLAILDKPVQWGEAKVQVVFLVSIADDATAKLQKFYQVVAQLMVDEACICKLIAERRFEVLLGLLRQKEQGLEEQENG